jgi:anti-anti-sigma factor
MADRTHDRDGPDPTQAWLTAAEDAELGDLTSTAHPLWASATVSVRSEDGGHVVVEVGGELAAGSAAYLDVVLEQEFSAAPTAVVVDLSDTVFVGVRGVAALVRAAARAVDSMTTLCVVAPLYCDLARHLRIAGLEDLFNLHSSVAHCRAALTRREPVRSPATPSRSWAGRRTLGRGNGVGELSTCGDPDLRIAVRQVGRFALVRLSGPLSLRTVGAVATALAKLLLEGGRVVADLSDLRLRWTPALQVFPSALAALGGWPAARLVLLDPDPQVGAAVRGLRIDRAVPVAGDLAEARALIESRPAVVTRYHELPPEPGSPRRARALLRSACRDWQIEDAVPEAAIVVSELVSNAVQHAGTGCRVSLRLDDTALHVSVRDHQSADELTLGRLFDAETSGRGLRIVAAFSRAHGVTPHADGKTVWAVVGLHPAT